MKKLRRQSGRPAFDLLEEATRQLRAAPALTLALYYLGAIPLVLGLLYFEADMTRSPFAAQELAPASLAVALLYVWMKFWQVLFARRLRAQIAVATPAPLNFHQLWRITLIQAASQPVGFFLLPLALVAVLPFASVFALFQNLTVLGQNDDVDPGESLLKKAWRQAALWPRQNYLLLVLLFTFSLLVFLNWLTVCLTLPGLLKTFLGVETAFSRSPWSMLNSTFLAVICGLTWLCVDPLVKTIYTLRCFYGESLQSGGDLQASLRVVTLAARKGTALVGFGLITLLAASAGAAVPGGNRNATTGQLVRPALDQAINETIHETKYAWRLPHKEVVSTTESDSVLVRFFDDLGQLMHSVLRSLYHAARWLYHKLFPERPVVHTQPPSSGYGWIMSEQILLYGLVALVISVLAILLLRNWQNRRREPLVAAAEMAPVPDVADDNVSADQLPEDGWSKLARELMEHGEWRLALRALYLASLAHLAAREWIRLARFKSNREYERELRRRAHALPQVLAAFGENLDLFESIWYGRHTAGPELVQEFLAKVETIRAAG